MNVTNLREVLHREGRAPFFSKLNLWDIVDEVVVGVDLQMSLGFELSDLPDIHLSGESGIESHFSRIRRLLESLDENLLLQFVVQVRNGDREGVLAYTRRAEETLSDLNREVLGFKERYLLEKFLQRKEVYLFLTEVPSRSHIETKGFKGLVRKGPTISPALGHEARVHRLNGVAQGVMNSLYGMGIRARRLTDGDLSQYIFKHLNPGHLGDSEGLGLNNLREGQTLRSALVQSPGVEEFDRFRVGGFDYRGVNLLQLPDELDGFSLHRYTSDLWPDYDMVLTVSCGDSEAIIKDLKSSANWAKSFRLPGFKGHYEADQKVLELEELIREIRGTTQKLFRTSFMVLFREKDRQLLEENATIGRRRFSEMGSATGILDDLHHEDLFLSVLPNHSQFNFRRYVIHSGPLAYLAPISAPWRGTKGSKMLFETPQGSLVNMDLFDESLPAKHGLVIGTTGSGKSFTTNYLLMNFLIESERNHVVVIDIGGSYRKLSSVFGGQYLQVELSEEFAFNPFPTKGRIMKGTEFDPDELAYITLILERMVLDGDGKLGNVEEALLEKAIKLVYKGLTDEAAPLLEDIRRQLERLGKDSDSGSLATNFAKHLEIWTDGRYGKVFNHARRLKVENRLIVFDLEKLNSHPRLQSVYFHVIREIINSKLQRLDLQKMIVIDEGWRFFNDEVGSKLIQALYRTARKGNGLILSISQSAADFLGTKAATAIVTNSYVKYILRLSKGHELLGQFGLSDSEVEAVKGLTSVPRKYSDLFLKFNEQGAVIRLEPSPLDYWICTTDANDRIKEEGVRKAHGDWSSVQVLKHLAGYFQDETQSNGDRRRI